MHGETLKNISQVLKYKLATLVLSEFN